MGLRTALSQNRWVTFGVILATVWTVFVAFEVWTSMQSLFAPTGFGQTAVSGLIGLVVLALLFGLLVTLYGELSETSPTPATWPPEE